MNIEEFNVTCRVPKGSSLSGVLFNIAMLLLLTKLNCLAIKDKIRPYQSKAEKFLTHNGYPVVRNIMSAYAVYIISVKDLDLRK